MKTLYTCYFYSHADLLLSHHAVRLYSLEEVKRLPLAPQSVYHDIVSVVLLTVLSKTTQCHQMNPFLLYSHLVASFLSHTYHILCSVPAHQMDHLSIACCILICFCWIDAYDYQTASEEGNVCQTTTVYPTISNLLQPSHVCNPRLIREETDTYEWIHMKHQA